MTWLDWMFLRGCFVGCALAVELFAMALVCTWSGRQSHRDRHQRGGEGGE